MLGPDRAVVLCFEQVKALIEEQECPAHVVDRSNVSALMHACARGSEEIAR